MAKGHRTWVLLNWTYYGKEMVEVGAMLKENSHSGEGCKAGTLYAWNPFLKNIVNHGD